MPAALTKPAFDLGIVTADIEASLRFYRDLLGLVPLMTFPTAGGDLHLLIAGEMMIKLLDSPGSPAGPKGDIPEATGFRYLTFWISNLEELLGELTDAGVEVLRPPFDVAPGTTGLLVLDPDGNVVEFLQTAS